MKRAVLLLIICAMLVLGCTAALAATNRFVFTEQAPTIFEGDTLTVDFERLGEPAEEGTITLVSANERIATVTDDGTVTGLSKGTVNIVATLTTANRTWKTTMKLTVARKVTAITVNEKNMTIYEPDDEKVSELLQEDVYCPVLVLAVGKGLSVSASCEPQDANDRRFQVESSDPKILTVSGTNIHAVKTGECDLIVSSRQIPGEVFVVYHVLTIQPITKIGITSDSNTVSKGETIQLIPNYTPTNATIREVTWKSGNERIAAVDEYGTVTGISRGYCYITATAADGSGRYASYKVTVTQPVEGVHMKSGSYAVDVDSYVIAKAVLEPENANNDRMTWYSEDPSIARVSGNNTSVRVTGVSWGTTTVYGVTEDGDFDTSFTVKVGTYNKAIGIKSLDIRDGNISIVLKNKSNMDITRINFYITCYSMTGKPLPCTKSGATGCFGSYQQYLPAGDTTQHGRFTFYDFKAPKRKNFGGFELWITDYVTEDGMHYSIPEDKQPHDSVYVMEYNPDNSGGING